jgi:hypothetical protein
MALTDLANLFVPRCCTQHQNLKRVPPHAAIGALGAWNATSSRIVTASRPWTLARIFKFQTDFLRERWMAIAAKTLLVHPRIKLAPLKEDHS